MGPLSALALSTARPYRFQAALERLAALGADDLAAVLEAVPSEWGFSSRRRRSALDFLLARQARLPSLARRLEALWSTPRPDPA